MRNLFILTALLLILAASFSPARSAPAAEPEISRQVDGVIDQALSQKRIVGTVVIVVVDGRIIYHRVAGYADREGGIPMREDSVFRLASASKAIVSAAALRLVEEGKLGLVDPVTRWLPDFKPRLADGSQPVITVRELLSHTAGLNYGFLEPLNGPYHRLGVSDGMDSSPVSLDENIRRIGSAPLLYPPGSQWQYSLAIDVLGAIVTKAGGADLPTVVHRLITGPLGMNDTSFFAKSPDRLTAAYANGSPQPSRMTDPQRIPYGDSEVVYSPRRALDKNAYPSGGAGMIGTAGDYVKFLETIRLGGKEILRPESVKLMTENQVGDLAVPAAGDGWGWGLGFAVLKNPQSTGSPLSPGSWKWGGAYGHSFWVDPVRHMTVVAFTNTALEGMSGKFPDDLKQAVYAGLSDDLPKSERK